MTDLYQRSRALIRAPDIPIALGAAHEGPITRMPS
jgi:hypothetical protein